MYGIELAEKAEKTSKSAKILEKIGDIKNIADVAEDFAQDTQNVERYVNEIESGLDTGIQRELDDLLNSDYYKYDLGYDCSEIAEDFYNAAGNQGNIYRIEGKNGIINGYEYNAILEFDYHEVYSDGISIYDPRYQNVPITKDDYFRALREINPDGFDVFTIKQEV